MKRSFPLCTFSRCCTVIRCSRVLMMSLIFIIWLQVRKEALQHKLYFRWQSVCAAYCVAAKHQRLLEKSSTSPRRSRWTLSSLLKSSKYLQNRLLMYYKLQPLPMLENSLLFSFTSDLQAAAAVSLLFCYCAICIHFLLKSAMFCCATACCLLCPSLPLSQKTPEVLIRPKKQ